MHQCSVCSKSFPSASKLERHHFTHTGQKPFTCSVCGKGFRQSIHLKRHTETHTGKNNPWSFPNDSLTHGGFTNAMEPVSTHQDQPSPEKPGHGFNIYNTLPMPPTRHLFPQPEETKEVLPLQSGASHTEIRHPSELMSPLIDNSFISQQNILPNGQFLPNPVFHENTLVSTGAGSGQTSAGFWPAEQRQTDKRHSCTVCLKSFNSSYHLQRHIPTHSQLKPFECETCGKAFKQKAHLRAHSQSHHVAGGSDDHPAPESHQQGSSAGKMRVNHQCPTCLKTFCSPSKLKRHFMIHTGQKPYSCGDCGKSFRQVWHLKTHLDAHRCVGAVADVKSERSQSGNNNNNAAASPSPGDLKSSEQGDPVEAELRSFNAPPGLDPLGTTSQSPTDVKEEQQAHYQCSICSKTFSSLSKHRQHYMTHKELRPFQCHVCNRAFRLAVHLKRHQISHKNQGDEFQNQSMAENPGDALLDSVSRHQQTDSGMSSQLNDVDVPHLNAIVKPENSMQQSNDDQDSPTQGAEPTMTSDQRTASGQVDGESQKTRHKPHQCPTCLKGFPSPSKLQRHMMTHTGQRPFGCETCGKRFRQLSHLRIHSRTHLWTKYYKQRLPNATRPHSGVTEHDTGLSENASLQEQVSQKLSGSDASTEREFGQLGSVASGWSDNNNKKRGFQRSTASPFRPQWKAFASTRQRHYNCNDCGKLFTQVAQLKLHACSNDGLQNKVGLDCGTFPPQPTPSNPVGLLKSNNNSETPGKKNKVTNPAGNTSYSRHQCLICCKYFPSFSKLERHSRVHTGLRPYQCLACGKTFRQASHLTVHERTHNKFGPLRPTSQQETASNVKTQRQQQQQPLYPKIHVQAPQTSSMTTDPRLSKSTKECERLQCKYEDPFSNQENTHHENKDIDLNDESTQSKMNKLASPINNKEATAKRRSHVCSVCQKGFDTPSKLSRHFLIHTGARPFKCSFCTKAFRQVWHRRNHERTHEIVPFGTTQQQDGRAMGSPESYPSEHQSETRSHMNASESDVHPRDDARHRSISPDPCLVGEETPPHPAETRDNKCVDFHGLPDQGMDYDSKARELYQCPECHSVYQTPSELASHLEVHWRVGTQDLAGPSSSQAEPGGSAHSMGMAFPSARAPDQADGREVFGDRRGTTGSGTDGSGGEIPPPVEMHFGDWTEPLESFPCNKCLRSFETERVLRLHKCGSPSQGAAVHANQYQCAICFKNFVSPSKLKRHYVTHTGQRPYECEVCVKSFTQLSHLKTHRHRAHKE